MDLASELRSVVSALAMAEVPYALAGGLAVAVWGAPRATKDIDLLVLPQDLGAAMAALRPLGYTLEAGPMEFSDGMSVQRVNKVADGDLMTVDFLLVNASLQQVFASRTSRMLGNVGLQVVSREGLIQMKLVAGRPQDQVDVIKLSEMDR